MSGFARTVGNGCLAVAIGDAVYIGVFNCFDPSPGFHLHPSVSTAARYGAIAAGVAVALLVTWSVSRRGRDDDDGDSRYGPMSAVGDIASAFDLID